ncbi:Uncharacterised protein [Mycobacteroides abscessus subsp. abscessus]|nr:Uncharacterised protein [Mycobacteroides abscessus subsp. abscessus]
MPNRAWSRLPPPLPLLPAPAAREDVGAVVSSIVA